MDCDAWYKKLRYFDGTVYINSKCRKIDMYYQELIIGDSWYYGMHFSYALGKKTILTCTNLIGFKSVCSVCVRTHACVCACACAVCMCVCKFIASELNWFWLSQFEQVWSEVS